MANSPPARMGAGGIGRRLWSAVVTLALATSGALFAGAPAHAAGFGAVGEFTPVGPYRIVDTRRVDSPVTGVRSFGSTNTFDVQVLGADALGGPADIVPAANVTAVFVNITVLQSTVAGYLTAWPTDQTRPVASNVNVVGPQAVTNMALVRPGVDGAIRLGLGPDVSGTAHVTIDVLGYLSSSGGTVGGRLVRMSPRRYLDTRSGPGPRGAVGPLGDVGFQIKGASIGGSVPIPNASSITAVVVNLTATQPTSATTISAGPTKMTNPVVSDISVAAGQTRANLAVLPIGPDGKAHLFNRSGKVHLVADVLGYFQKGSAATSTKGRVLPLLNAVRVIDTRQSRPRAGAGTLGPELAENWSFSAFVASVQVGGVPVGPQSALFMSVVGIKPTNPFPTARTTTYLKLYATGAAFPNTSNVNLALGEVVPNMVLASLSTTDSLTVYNDFGYVHYAADVAAVVLE